VSKSFTLDSLPPPSSLPSHQVDKFRPETCCIIGNYYSLKVSPPPPPVPPLISLEGQHEKAVVSFQRALKVDRKYLPAWTLMGHEYVELRNTTAAVQCYRQVPLSLPAIAHSPCRLWRSIEATIAHGMVSVRLTRCYTCTYTPSTTTSVLQHCVQSMRECGVLSVDTSSLSRTPFILSSPLL
jgi:hypothetical protein